MIKITKSQMAALELATASLVVRRIDAFISEHCDFSHPYDGSPALTPDERLPVIRELVGRARSYGILTERGFVQFAILGLGYSRHFDEGTARASDAY